MALQTVELADFNGLIDQLADAGLTIRVRTAGNSMYPVISGGDYIYIAPVEYTDIHRGDVIVFRQVGRLVCHRVKCSCTSNGERTYITQGDTMLAVDIPAGKDALVGKVVQVERTTCSWKRKIALLLSSLLCRVMVLHRFVFYTLLHFTTRRK